MLLYFIIGLIIIYFNIQYIPSYNEHTNRNINNILPYGKLKHIKSNKYQDEKGIIWLKRSWFQSIFHEPNKYYVFESDNPNLNSSYEAVILQRDFDNNIYKFDHGTYNYSSSFRHPIKHFFSDMLPSIIYIFKD